MKRLFPLIGLGFLMVTGLPAAPTAAAEEGLRYEVTITNLTRGQQFTPILVASHREGVQLFTLGRPASSELATLAEEGNTGPLASLLLGLPVVRDVASSSGLLNPGHSVTVIVQGGDGFNHLSVAAMLIPTNDGFL